MDSTMFTPNPNESIPVFLQMIASIRISMLPIDEACLFGDFRINTSHHTMFSRT